MVKAMTGNYPDVTGKNNTFFIEIAEPIHGDVMEAVVRRIGNLPYIDGITVYPRGLLVSLQKRSRRNARRSTLVEIERYLDSLNAHATFIITR